MLTLALTDIFKESFYLGFKKTREITLVAGPQVRKVPKSILRAGPRMGSSAKPRFGSMFSHRVAVWSWGSYEITPNFSLFTHKVNSIRISASVFLVLLKVKCENVSRIFSTVPRIQ